MHAYFFVDNYFLLTQNFGSSNAYYVTYIIENNLVTIIPLNNIMYCTNTLPIGYYVLCPTKYQMRCYLYNYCPINNVPTIVFFFGQSV